MFSDQHLDLLRRLDQAGDQANLWQAGGEMGLDRPAAEVLAMDLMAGGILEVVNLSGKVRLTDQGRGLLGGGGGDLDLAGLVAALEALDLGLGQPAAGDLMADLTCLKAQLGRSRPLVPVVRACLAAVESILGQSRHPEAKALAARAGALREA
ncbi:MAG: hypothetical protein LDL11_06915 [Desulfarculus sp.]|nr:hypothetical protein [Desulfarculus sp.]